MVTEDNIYYIYRHIRNDINVPFYIGIGKISSTYNRSMDKRRNNIWKSIVKKIDNNYSVDIILSDLTQEDALIKESEFIKLYGKLNNNTGTLANMLDYGSKKPEKFLSEENKELLKDNMINNKFAKGYKHTDKTKEKMSLIRTGKPKKRGYKLSDDTRNKMSISSKGNKSTKGCIWINNGTINKVVKDESFITDGWIRGQIKRVKFSEETRKRMSEAKKGKKLLFTKEQMSNWSKGNKSAKGCRWTTNGIINLLIKPKEDIKEGFYYGRTNVTK